MNSLPETNNKVIIVAPEFKLKDGLDRRQVNIDLKAVFGVIPEQIAIRKVLGKNNTFVLFAEIDKKEEVQNGSK